jgi:ribonucleoside-diphosphate reductase alpha chain
MEVMNLHRDAVQDIDPTCPDYLRQAAQESADRMVALGERHGYRNAQATVIAPTGTIGFYMDCDTTGIEPDIALVKYKLLAGEGEGMFKIVNKTVPLALERLGYDEDERMAIIEYIDENDTIEGAPVLKDEHLPVFDCAFQPANGERSIHHMGHIRMMAAVQPFVSGAISKTVNMPEHSTVEDIADAYQRSWELGLKAVAIYRENSKRSQPLSTSEDGNTKKAETEEAAEVDPSGDGAIQGDPEIEEKVVYKPTRKRLPDERPSITHKFSIAGHEGYITVGLYPETEKPGEIFITIAKQGSTLAGMMDAFATSVSIALQYGVPLEDLCRKFSHMRFEPSGFTNNKQIPIAKSMMDYIFRYLAIKFLDKEVETADPEAVDPNQAAAEEADRSGPAADASQGELDFGTMDEPTDDANSELIGQTVEAFMSATTASEAQSDAVKQEAQQTYQNQSDAPPCPDCGSITIRNGACYSCPNCGASTGCG